MKFKYENDCDCETCKGHESSTIGLLGGWICMCPCHNNNRGHKKEKKELQAKETIKAKRKREE